MTREQYRLQEIASGKKPSKIPWRKWGPYLSERQWGTVREDYSRDGNAWDYFSHDQARSRGGRTVLPGSVMKSSCCASALVFGMATIQY